MKTRISEINNIKLRDAIETVSFLEEQQPCLTKNRGCEVELMQLMAEDHDKLELSPTNNIFYYCEPTQVRFFG